ncbi:MAG: spore coat U domain-containing protein [Polyangiaceae bacterium]|jgi:spore coat protein U-like protein|nr:spore coat U domain-containing protein [Polyangiaceae bacterium]
MSRPFWKILPWLAAVLSVSMPARAITSCSIVSTTSVAFGAYDPLAPLALDSTGSLTYQCSGVGLTDTILIHLGRGGSSSFFPRRMTSGASSLAYNLFLDASRLLVWGDGTGGSLFHGPVTPPESSNVTVNIFGRIPAGQNPSVGSYSDTLVITLLY